MLALKREPIAYPEDRWSILNNSRGTRSDPALARYHTLLDALNNGWQVDPPVYVRNDWSLKHSNVKVFHFVLCRDSKRMSTLFSVPDCEAVRRLVSENGWQLNSNES